MADTAAPGSGASATTAGTLFADTASMEAPSPEMIERLAGGEPHVALRGLQAGYGGMEIVHGIDLMVGRGQSLCIIGPNGAGKSTVLHAVFGLADRFGGRIEMAGRDVAGLSVRTLMMDCKAAYVLQAGSVFPDMTVEENLFMGGMNLESRRHQQLAIEKVFDENEMLRRYRNEAAGVLSGGERRQLELSRALMIEPQIVFVDEPTIGLEPRAVDQIFGILDNLQRSEGKTIVIVEQNARMGLQFADIGYVMVAGRIALADRADSVLANPRVGQLFLGG